MIKFDNWYVILFILIGSITITTVVADTVTVNTYPYQIPGSTTPGVIVASSGNVGIGDTNPLFALSVNSTGDTALGIGSSGTGGGTWFLQTVKSDSSGRLRFVQSTGAEAMTILKNNYVGVGTTNPSSTLTLSSPGDTSFTIKSTATNGNTWFEQTLGSDNSGRFRIVQASGVDAFTITKNNFVGIGTGAPAQKLDVIGNIRLTGNLTSPNDICIGTC